jgi:hypothetical protein
MLLTEKGQVYHWARDIPPLFVEVGELKMRRVAAGWGHSAALTDEGRLYTRGRHAVGVRSRRRRSSAVVGVGYTLADLGDCEGAVCRPRCVETALAGVRIVSVAAGY